MKRLNWLRTDVIGDRPLRALGWMVISAACLSVMNIFVKQLAPVYPAAEIIGIRYLVCAVALFIVIRVRGLSFSLGQSKKSVLLHSATGAMAIFCLVSALAMLPMAIAVMLYWCCPIFVMIFSKLFTGESLSRRGLALVALSFTGLVLMTMPQLGLHSAPMLSLQGVAVGILGAALAGAAYVSLRMANKGGASASVVVFYASIVAVTLSLPAMLFAKPLRPDSVHFTMMLLVGFFSLLGQFALTKSYRYASAPLASCMALLNVAFSIICGNLFFEERLTFSQTMGMLVLNLGILSLTLTSVKLRTTEIPHDGTPISAAPDAIRDVS